MSCIVCEYYCGIWYYFYKHILFIISESEAVL